MLIQKHPISLFQKSIINTLKTLCKKNNNMKMISITSKKTVKFLLILCLNNKTKQKSRNNFVSKIQIHSNSLPLVIILIYRIQVWKDMKVKLTTLQNTYQSKCYLLKNKLLSVIKEIQMIENSKDVIKELNHNYMMFTMNTTRVY